MSHLLKRYTLSMEPAWLKFLSHGSANYGTCTTKEWMKCMFHSRNIDKEIDIDTLSASLHLLKPKAYRIKPTF